MKNSPYPPHIIYPVKGNSETIIVVEPDRITIYRKWCWPPVLREFVVWRYLKFRADFLQLA